MIDRPERRRAHPRQPGRWRGAVARARVSCSAERWPVRRDLTDQEWPRIVGRIGRLAPLCPHVGAPAGQIDSHDLPFAIASLAHEVGVVVIIALEAVLVRFGVFASHRHSVAPRLTSLDRGHAVHQGQRGVAATAATRCSEKDATIRTCDQRGERKTDSAGQ